MTLFIRAWTPSIQARWWSPSRRWRNISEIRGKSTHLRQWSSMGGSHRGRSDGADISHFYWIISEIRVKITRPWLSSSEHERLRGKSGDTSPPRICSTRSSMGGRHRGEPDGACPIIPLLNRGWKPSNDFGEIVWGRNVLIHQHINWGLNDWGRNVLRATRQADEMVWGRNDWF